MPKAWDAPVGVRAGVTGGHPHVPSLHPPCQPCPGAARRATLLPCPAPLQPLQPPKNTGALLPTPLLLLSTPRLATPLWTRGPGGREGAGGARGDPRLQTHHGAARGGRCGGGCGGWVRDAGPARRGGRGADTLAHSAGWAAEGGGGGGRREGERGRASRELKASDPSSPAREDNTTLSVPFGPPKIVALGATPSQGNPAKIGSQQILGG